MHFSTALKTLVLVSFLSLILAAPGAAQAGESTETAPISPTPTPTTSPTPSANQSDNGSASNQTEATEQSFVARLKQSEDECSNPRAIDPSTVVCSGSIDGDVAVLKLRSDIIQRVTITDAGGLMQEGEVRRESRTLRKSEVNTIRFPITRHNGFSGVTIDTGRTLYGLPLEDNTALIGGTWTRSDVTIGALTGAGSVAVMSIIIVIRTVTGKADEPERIA